MPIGTDWFAGEDELEHVPRVYRLAFVCGYRPTKAVQEALGCTAGVAQQKVWLARGIGLLPTTEPGKARA
jgi:hypothetical protein